MFKFVPDTVGGLGSKRKIAPRSCDTCRKRHKRCSHVTAPSLDAISTSPSKPTAEDGAALEDGPSASAATAAPTARTNPATTSAVSVQAWPVKLGARDDRDSAAHPTAPLAHAPPRHSSSSGAYLRFVGDLSPEASFLMNQKRQPGSQKQRAEIGVWLGQRPEETPDEVDNAILIEPTSSPPFHLDGLLGLKALYPYLRKECAMILPPEYEFGLICNVYLAKFDPIFPILHGEDFDSHDPFDATVLKQSICLIAALDPSLRTHLRLLHAEAVLSQKEFRSRIATALKHALDAGFIRHKMVLLQVTAIMAFYVEQPQSSEISSHYTAQSVELTQTLGLHLGWPSNGVSTDKASRIFWCIWTLDRLNAATNGRPTMIHSRDMDTRILESVQEQQPAFRLSIRISKLLDETISQYRPGAQSDGIDTSHTFEAFVQEVEAGNVGNALLASLELFYLAVVILQSRSHGAQDGRTLSSNLQSYSALSIVAIASGEFRTSMTYWAVVPYAVSLAASVAYQSLRNSNLPYKRKQAYTVFYSSCDVLDELGRYFRSAQALAQLAKDTVQEVERVSSSRTRSKQQQGEESQMRMQPASVEPATGPGNGNTSNPNSTDYPEGRSLPMQAVEPSALSIPIEGAVSPFDTSMFDGLDMEDVGGIFDEFDPKFQWVDAVFSANLNPTVPLFPEQWVNDNEGNNNH